MEELLLTFGMFEGVFVYGLITKVIMDASISACEVVFVEERIIVSALLSLLLPQ